MEITKAPQNGEMQTTWKHLYEADWEQGFNTFMLILAQQYKIELMVQIGNNRQPSPVIQFWRDALKGSLSPQQMLAGLRGWQGTEQRGFQPTPEDILENGRDVETNDRPHRKKDPNCEWCGGQGWRLADGRKWVERKVGFTAKLARCDCSVIVYKDATFKPEPLKLAVRSAEEENSDSAKAALALSKKLPDLDKSIKTIPVTLAYMPSEAELERKKQEAFELAEKYK